MAGLEQLDADEHGEDPAEQEREENGEEIHQADPFMIDGDQPGFQAAGTAEVVAGHFCAFTNSTSAWISRSRNMPWKVGMIGSKLATILAWGSRIDSRT